MWSISPKRSIWSRITLVMTTPRVRTWSTKRTAQASSISNTPIVWRSLPRIDIPMSTVEAMPRVKFAPVRLVRTWCWVPRMSAIIFTVVVLPLVPVTTMTPPGSDSRALRRKPGLIFSATRPGNEEPRLPSKRPTTTTSLPM